MNKIYGNSNNSISNLNIIEQAKQSNDEEKLDKLLNEAQKLLDEVIDDVHIRPDITDLEANISEVKEIDQVVENLDSKVEGLTQGIDNKINAYLVDHPQISDEEKIRGAIKIILDQHKELEANIKNSIENFEKGEMAAEYLKYPTESLLIGLHLAETINEHVNFSLEISTVANLELMGLGLIGLGIRCYNLQKKGELITVYEEKKLALSEKLKKESNPSIKEDLEAEIQMIDKVLEEFKNELKIEIIDVTRRFFSEVFEKSSELAGTLASAAVLANHADIVIKLMEVSSGLSLAGAVISLGWTTYQVYSHSTAYIQTNKRMDSLKLKLQAFAKDDVYLVYIIQAKLDRLTALRDKQKLDLSMQALKLSASSLAMAAVLKGVLISTGIAVGATASVALNAVGIGGVVLLLGASTATGGIAAYRNRYNIEYGIKALPLMVQQKILNRRLNEAHRTNEKAIETINLLQSAYQKNNAKKKELLTIPTNINELLNQGNHQRAFTQVMKNQSAIGEKLGIVDQINFDSQVVKMNTQTKSSSVNNKRTEVKRVRDLKNQMQQFNKYDLATLNIVRKVTETGISDSQVHDQIKTFLKSEGSPTHNKVLWEDVLNYILATD